MPLRTWSCRVFIIKLTIFIIRPRFFVLEVFCPQVFCFLFYCHLLVLLVSTFQRPNQIISLKFCLTPSEISGWSTFLRVSIPILWGTLVKLFRFIVTGSLGVWLERKIHYSLFPLYSFPSLKLHLSGRVVNEELTFLTHRN